MFLKLLTSVIFSAALFSTTSSLEAFSISLGFGFQPAIRPVVVTQTVPVVQEVFVIQQPPYQPIYQPVMHYYTNTPVYTNVPVYTGVRTVYATDHAPVFTSTSSTSSVFTFKSSHKHRRHHR